MSKIQPAAHAWLDRLKAEWMLVLFGLLTIMLALTDPQPWATYHHWLQLPTLAALTGLMIAIQGIRDSGVVQRMAAALAERMHSVRALGVLLVSVTALLSMLLTNDVSLFLIVPLTVALGSLSNLPVLRMVILEALAVNAGSALSPIGNPQNLLLWQHSQLPMLTFVSNMLPAFAAMFALVFLLTWCWLPGHRIALQKTHTTDNVSPRLATLSTLGLISMVVLMELDHAVMGAALLLAAFMLGRRRVLAELDWLLLLTFATIFLGLGHVTHLPLVQHALERLDLQQPLSLYLTGIVASQLISNVPATVLLLEHARNPMALAVAVNVGGFGTVIGSMANLIALRLARQPHGMLRLQQVSIPFLLVCAPLIYLVYRGFA